MVPTSSISKMFDIIRGRDVVSSYSTEQLKEILYILQHGDLSSSCDDNGNPLLRCSLGIIRPVINQADMEKIIRLEGALISELRKRGECVPERKFS